MTMRHVVGSADEGTWSVLVVAESLQLSVRACVLLPSQ
jgi:hypothetical protein